MNQTKDNPLLRGRDKGKTVARIGVGLIFLSCVLWFSLFVIPFLPLTDVQRVVTIGAVLVGVQFAWWSGAAIVGPQAIAKLWSWCRKRQK